MPQNSNFLLLRGHRFGQKVEFLVMALNHGGDPLGSILGSMGSHWDQKMGENRKKVPCPKSEFLTTPWSSIWAKNRIYGYDAKSRWGPPRSILGPMGSHWGEKMGQNRKKLPCPKIRILTDPRSSIWAKNRMYGYDAKSRWGPPRVHFGPIGSHWGQKMGQNRTKLPCPKIRIFDYSAVIDLCKKSNLRLRRQITMGNPWGLSLGQWGAIGTKKLVKTVKNCHAPKFEFLTTPRSTIWAKNGIYGYGTK